MKWEITNGPHFVREKEFEFIVSSLLSGLGEDYDFPDFMLISGPNGSGKSKLYQLHDK